MQCTWKSAVACSILVGLLSLAGCGSGGEGNAENEAAANGNGGGEAGATETATQGSMATQGTMGARGSMAAPSNPTAAPLARNSLGPELAAGGHASLPPVVSIKTSLGEITVELDKEEAPVTVHNFLEYVESRFYDGTVFHQVWPGRVILGGAYAKDGEELKEKPARGPIPNEAANGLKNTRGTIAMARQHDVINSSTCQFFINAKDNPNYDHQPGAQESLNPEDYGYCVFGRVTPESMEVVDRIAEVEVQDRGDFERIPVETVRIESIRKIR